MLRKSYVTGWLLSKIDTITTSSRRSPVGGCCRSWFLRARTTTIKLNLQVQAPSRAYALKSQGDTWNWCKLGSSSKFLHILGGIILGACIANHRLMFPLQNPFGNNENSGNKTDNTPRLINSDHMNDKSNHDSKINNDNSIGGNNATLPRSSRSL